MLKLLKLKPVSGQLDKMFLYDLLAERTEDINISHKSMPTWDQHERFVDKEPYLHWFILVDKDERVGSVYLTHNYEIGLFIKKDKQRQGYGSQAVDLLLGTVGAGRYLANIAPGNVASMAFFQKIGFRHIQNTLEYSYK